MEDTILTCPVCKGWGFNKLPLTSDVTPCSYCHGKSVQAVNADFYLNWDIPAHIDLGGRQANKRKSKLLIGGLLLAILIIIVILVLLIQSGIK